MNEMIIENLVYSMSLMWFKNNEILIQKYNDIITC